METVDFGFDLVDFSDELSRPLGNASEDIPPFAVRFTTFLFSSSRPSETHAMICGEDAWRDTAVVFPASERASELLTTGHSFL